MSRLPLKTFPQFSVFLWMFFRLDSSVSETLRHVSEPSGRSTDVLDRTCWHLNRWCFSVVGLLKPYQEDWFWPSNSVLDQDFIFINRLETSLGESGTWWMLLKLRQRRAVLHVPRLNTRSEIKMKIVATAAFYLQWSAEKTRRQSRDQNNQKQKTSLKEQRGETSVMMSQTSLQLAC